MTRKYFGLLIDKLLSYRKSLCYRYSYLNLMLILSHFYRTMRHEQKTDVINMAYVMQFIIVNVILFKYIKNVWFKYIKNVWQIYDIIIAK